MEQEQRRFIESQKRYCFNTMTRIEKIRFLIYSLKDTMVLYTKTIKEKGNNPTYNKRQ